MTYSGAIERFGKYLLLKRVGSGGMAEVFLARPAQSAANGSVVALKRLLPQVMGESVYTKMFRAEIHACAALKHPNIVQIYDFGEEGAVPYLAMEYIEGVSVRQLVAKYSKNGEFLPVCLAMSLGAQAASGLQYAHEFENPVTGETFRLVHRDISPQNLILSYDGNLKVIDFGIAKPTAGRCDDVTEAGTLKGKVAYMSPEQVEGGKIDARSDVFSLGAVIWEMLTGRRAFAEAGDSDITVLGKIMEADQTVVPPSQFNSQVPPELDDIVLKCLAQDRERRYQTAAELQIELSALLRAMYPQYTYAEGARIVKEAFQAEMIEDRKELRELNEQAQEQLNATTVTPPPISVQGNAAAQAAQAAHAERRASVFERLGIARLTVREAALIMLAAISFAFLQLERSYSFVDRIFLPTHSIRIAASRLPASKHEGIRKANAVDKSRKMAKGDK